MIKYVKRYIFYLESKNLSKSTVRKNKYILTKYLKYVQQDFVLDTKQKINFIDSLHHSQSRNTLINNLNMIKNFYLYCIEVEQLKIENPFCMLQMKRTPRKLPAVFFPAELENLFNLIDNDEFLSIDKRFLFELFVDTGARIDELLNVTLLDIDYTRKTILLRKTKNSAYRICFFGNKLLELLPPYLEFRDKIMLKYNETHYFLLISKKAKACVISKIYRDFEFLSKRYNYVIKPHKLRHSFATYLLNQGVGLRDVQELLGHKNIKTTTFYTRVETKTLKTTIKNCHPRGSLIE